MAAKKKSKSEDQMEATSDANEQKLDGSQESESDVPLAVIIEVRAYEIYQQRGDGEGDSVSDWLRAEREILHEVARASAGETARRDEARQSESGGLRQKSSAGG